VLPEAKDQANTQVRDGWLPTLTTQPFGFVAYKGKSNIVSIDNTTTSALFSWGTNQGANSNYIEWYIEGGKFDGTSGLSGQAADPKTGLDLLNHQVVIKGLKSKTTYRYRVNSVSTDGYMIRTPENNDWHNWPAFQTATVDTAQFIVSPNSSNVAEQNISATSAMIVWTTTVPTQSWVKFGTKAGAPDYSVGNNVYNTQHAVKLENLQSGMTYYYHVEGEDESGSNYTSPEYSFRAIAKPKIANVRTEKVTPYSVTIAWETNVPTETTVNWGTSAAYGSRVGKPGKALAHSLDIDNLTDDVLYHFQIVARDEYGNEVLDTDHTVRTPLDTEGPKIIGVKTDIMPLGDNDSNAQVIVSWQTNKPATTKVEFDEGIIGGRYTKSSTEDATLNNSHTVIIKGLNVATTYHYRIVTKDKRGNETISNDYTFVTPSKEQSIWQLIVKSLQDTFAWTQNLGSIFKRKN
jgi:hypothetical protein